jgi:Uma2 family endonuclease
MSTATSITTAEELFQDHPQERCELVRGELRIMSPAGGEHGWIIINVTTPLASFVKEHRLGYVFGAETGFILERNPDTVRAPDVAFLRKDRVKGRPTKKFIPGPPDLAVEVLSPNDTASEVSDKVEAWLKAGCQAVWVVDPQRQTASICHLDGDAIVWQPVDELSFEPLLPGFRLPMRQVFE